MQCFKHVENSGVGICKSCYKAVCKECAIEISNALACSEECSKITSENDEMNERAKSIYGIGNRKSKIPATGVIIWSLLSLAYWGIVIVSYVKKDHIDYGNLAVAVLFTVIAAVVFYSSKRTGIKC